MMRAALAIVALALCACSQAAAPQQAASQQIASQQVASTEQPCDLLEHDESLTPRECRIDAGGQTLHVTFAEVPAGAEGGAVTVDVLDADGGVAQSLLESDVWEYVVPSVEDINGDGRGDILIARVTGNVNTEWGVWINSGDRYRRVGEINGVEVKRTADGYIAVPARSSCCSWNVAYYRLDQSGLHHLVTAQIDGEEESPGGRVRSTCSISEAPGLVDLNLSRRAAQQRFCAEPASQVYGP